MDDARHRVSRLSGAAATACLVVALLSSSIAGEPRAATAAGDQRIEPPASSPAREPALASFLAQLTEIARRRDAAALMRLVIVDPGVEPGARDAMARRLRVRDPRSMFWRDLEWLLTLDGDSIGPGTYCLPYVASRFPDEKRDGLHGIVVRPRVAVRAEPSATAAVIATLSYDIVDLDRSFERPYDRSPDSYGEHGAPWIKIALPTGPRGYVAREDFWYALGPELCLTQRNGRWWIASFDYGD